MSEQKVPVSATECDELAQLMEYKYATFLDGRVFSVTTELKDDAVYVTVLLKNADDSFFYPVEARLIYEEEELSPHAAGLFLIDYIDCYFDEYFTEESENLFIPIDWNTRQWDAVDFQIRGQVLNLKVERMADALLAAGKPYEGRNIII